jgi:hypothetical protein
MAWRRCEMRTERKLWIAGVTLVLVIVSTPVFEQNALKRTPRKMESKEAGSSPTEMKFLDGTILNKGSTSTRHLFELKDETCPLWLGVVKLTPAKSVLGYALMPSLSAYRAFGRVDNGKLVVVSNADLVSAFEVRYLLFDTWGNFLLGLRAKKISDIDSDHRSFDINPVLEEREFWSVPKSILEDYSTVVIVLWRVKFSPGRTWSADAGAFLRSLKQLGLKMDSKYIDPDTSEREISDLRK